MKLNIWSTVDTENLVDRMVEPEIQDFILALDSEVASVDFTLELIHQLIDSLEIDGTVVVRSNKPVRLDLVIRSTKPVRLDLVDEPTKEDTKYDNQPFPQDTDCCSWCE